MNTKQQILHIHGGSPWGSYQAYLDSLKSKTFDPYAFEKKQRWHYHYYSYLNSQYFDVIKPEMPSKHNAHYQEWKIWFERHFDFLNDDLILVGHSLGGNFLLKYLANEPFPYRIKELHVIAAPLSQSNYDFAMAESELSNVSTSLAHLNIHIYHSKDDPVVSVAESEKYHTQIPNSQLHLFEDRGHFLGDTFPELFERIKNTRKR